MYEYSWVSTHSRPKAAGMVVPKTTVLITVSTHSRPKAAAPAQTNRNFGLEVSTHSRPKAAAIHRVIDKRFQGFNTQPPEGG